MVGKLRIKRRYLRIAVINDADLHLTGVLIRVQLARRLDLVLFAIYLSMFLKYKIIKNNYRINQLD